MKRYNKRAIILAILHAVLVCSYANAQSQADTSGFTCIFPTYEKAPHFPCPHIPPEECNGEQLALDFIKQNMRWPKVDGCIQGTVYLSFDVELDGRLTNIQVRKGLHPLFDEEAIRIIRLMPNWVPGQWKDKPSKMRMNLPIKFKLE
ncbi:MAG: TonB family protein [Saprospiraceae bacterium]|nr:TonB family protein [Saprospiraceae bacterium]